MSDRMRRTAATALAVVAALALSSCVTIPTSGPVITGREVSEQRLPPGTEIIPEGPVVGADQQAILSGFIAAYSGSGNYEVARQFLTTALADEWDPRESVLIRSGGTRFERLNDRAMEYDIVVSATVDRDGSYTAFSPASQSLNYEFVQEAGEWRISAAPDGIVLLEDTFDNLFSENALYFLDPTRQSLVPDLRWFPVAGGTAATRIATALLNGPSAWLEGAVGTAFPDGTQLSSPRRVAVESTVAVVDLTEDALAADEEQRQFMRAQLEASLGRLPSISSVQVSVGGTPLTIPPLGDRAPRLRPQVDSRMLVLRDGEFGYLANNRVAPIESLSEKVVSVNPTAATLSAAGTAAAVLGDGGAWLVRTGDDEPTLADPRPGLIAPTLDGYGYLWTAQRGDTASIRAIDAQGNQFPVQATLPADAEIVSLDVSRDGARVAVLLATDAGARLVVAAIIRDPNRNQAPVSLGEPRLDVITDSGTAVDATWMDEISVATLTRIGPATSVTAYQVGGKSTSLGHPGDAVAIVGGNGESGLRVLDEDGVISLRRGSSWQAGPSASFIATQR